MPLYEAQCAHCGKRESYFASIENRNETPSCCNSSRMARILSVPMLGLDIPPWSAYESPASGKWITSRREQKEDLLRTGKFLYEPGVKEDIKRNHSRALDKAFEPIAASIDSTVTAMAASGKFSET